MLKISNSVVIPDNEIELTAIRAQGAGGQNVNKVSSAIHLRFDIDQSSLPDYYKERLLMVNDKRISKDGVIIIKAQQYRTQERNKLNALERLCELILAAVAQKKVRRASKPSKASHRKRMDNKSQRGKVKALRSKISH